MSGELSLPQVGNLLNSNLVIDSYNDTGAGTHYYHTFTPFDGKFNLAPNGGGLGFPDTTTQTTAGLPLTGGTLSGKVILASIGVATPSLNLGGVCDTSPANAINGDLWVTNAASPKIAYRVAGSIYNVPTANLFNTFTNQNAFDTSSTTAAVRICQRGTGHALVVEDSTTPDTTSFGIDTAGRVSINTNQTTPINSYADLWVQGRAENQWAAYIYHTTGHGMYVQVSNGSSKDAIQASGGPIRVYDGISFGSNVHKVTDIGLPVVATGVYDKEIQISFNGVNYRIPCRSV
jgi:hypothetical protein